MSDHQELSEAIDIIDAKAKSFGLDFFETEFEIVPAELMAQIHAYILPVRFQHWSFGKRYMRIKTLAKYGLGGFAYETVINSDPAYSFLLSSNTLTEMKTVIAHVFGHVDFSKNNGVFASTNRRQVIDCAVNARTISEYAMQYGEDKVEQWLDACLALVEQISFSARQRRYSQPIWWMRGSDDDDELNVDLSDFDIDDEFDFLFSDDKARQMAEARQAAEHPTPILERDLLYFLMHSRFCDLDRWQRDVMAIVHEEFMYFQPNLRTRIMNEGWATYWHIKILEELDVECDFLQDDGEDAFLRYNRMNAGTLNRGSRGSINPYLVGLEIWRRIFERWENPSDEDKEKLGLPGGQGLQKMFEVRETMMDADFIRNYLDKETVDKLDLYCFQKTGMDWTITSTGWKGVRDQLSSQSRTRGMPIIYVVDDDYKDRRELLLFHEYTGQPLSEQDTHKTMGHLARVWGRPVTLVTVCNMTNEVGMTKQAPMTKKVVRGETYQAAYSHDGINSRLSIFVGEPYLTPTEFSKDHFHSKWDVHRVMAKLVRQPGT